MHETGWNRSKASTIRGGLKLFYHSVDGRRDGVWVILNEEYVKNELGSDEYQTGN